MVVLKPCADLEQIEQRNEWLQAKDFVFGNWRKNSNDLDKLIRVGTECWYILTFLERLENVKDIDREVFSDHLTEVKNYGYEHFSNSDTYLWVFGYMISLFPYWFSDFDGNSIYEWEEQGKNMIKKAYQLNPQNHIAKMLSIPEKGKEYKKACADVKKSLNQYFPGNSAIEEYFRSVLSRNP